MYNSDTILNINNGGTTLFTLSNFRNMFIWMALFIWMFDESHVDLKLLLSINSGNKSCFKMTYIVCFNFSYQNDRGRMETDYDFTPGAWFAPPPCTSSAAGIAGIANRGSWCQTAVKTCNQLDGRKLQRVMSCRWCVRDPRVPASFIRQFNTV